jgi:PAS domain S-box-containing protein
VKIKSEEMDNNEGENRMKESESKILIPDEISANSRNEMLFRKAIECAVPSGIAVIDDTGKQIYANQSFCKMVGYEEEELIGKQPPYEYWAQQDIENIKNALKQTLNNNAPKEGFDLIFCHKTGKLINVNVIISPFCQEDTKTFWVANVIDITERKREEKELIQSRLLLKSSMENLHGTIVFAIDKEYKYLFFNRAHWDSMKFAYDKDVKEGMNILECITTVEDRRLAKENYDRALRGESYSRVQSFGDNNLAYYESFFNPIVNDKNEIIGCTGLARNVTERKLAELTLKEAETKFKEIINQINDAIIVFDEQGKIIIWNEGATKISGLSADKTLNKNIVDIRYQFTPPAKRDRAQIENTIKKIISLEDSAVFNRIADSEIISLTPPILRNVQSIIFPIKLEGYNLFCAVLRDTTEIKRYENELMRISAEKDKFYSVIAQYLYTPFNLFSSFSKLMAEEMDTLPIREIQKMAAMMSKSATNLYSLLDNMLQWTRMNQGKIIFNPQKLNVMEISEDAISILKPNAGTKNITINILAEKELTVFADIYMLKTILRNLVSNAIKHTSDGGQINISTQQTPSSVIISVSVNGAGITPDYFIKLFENSELHSTIEKAEEKGTTLGLILCKEFVEKHSGKIWAERTKGDGQGIEFKFSIPVFSLQEENRNI